MQSTEQPTLFTLPPASRTPQSRSDQARQQRILRAVGDHREVKGKRNRVRFSGHSFDPDNDVELRIDL